MATTLWRWYPDALRAWLDCSRYQACEWISRKNAGTASQTITVSARKDRHISLGHYKDDGECLFGCVFNMPENGPWVPVSGTMSVGPVHNKAFVPGIGGMFARDLLYNPTWRADRATHKFVNGHAQGGTETHPDDVNNGDWEVDLLYHSRSNDVCQRCYQPKNATLNLRRCTRCLSAWYCSVQCEKDDWAAHKGVCRSRILTSCGRCDVWTYTQRHIFIQHVQPNSRSNTRPA